MLQKVHTTNQSITQQIALITNSKGGEQKRKNSKFTINTVKQQQPILFPCLSLNQMRLEIDIQQDVILKIQFNNQGNIYFQFFLLIRILLFQVVKITTKNRLKRNIRQAIIQLYSCTSTLTKYPQPKKIISYDKRRGNILTQRHNILAYQTLKGRSLKKIKYRNPNQNVSKSKKSRWRRLITTNVINLSIPNKTQNTIKQGQYFALNIMTIKYTFKRLYKQQKKAQIINPIVFLPILKRVNFYSYISDLISVYLQNVTTNKKNFILAIIFLNLILFNIQKRQCKQVQFFIYLYLNNLQQRIFQIIYVCLHI
ncbi:hypothetical protein TTHERM_000346599 (macronuclear) [Tetrahymena thermophila SB210]|uniref:Uncharacterized protein n=1 Tax=Tetrahymena thermophila (strain SB210) TaxID=312017 RepID=W7X3E7_TETTS|nr:hypothetical protein TTHERM_000346599 [Tetrahymena thermophila SB210]EWS73800.1 hypothetical protein TTHERM_000346599 [Tetrahymena thermophila SB210]|eukprot:XP_012653680.1 hypothetical protein TTHERM_000346599 [Tetrahymena thermophila SB210]